MSSFMSEGLKNKMIGCIGNTTSMVWVLPFEEISFMNMYIFSCVPTSSSAPKVWRTDNEVMVL